MTKRLLAFLLSTVMVLSMLPVSIMAEGAEPLSTAQQHTKYETLTAHDGSHICEHCIAAGKTEAEATVEWKAWGNNNEKTLPTTTGHYYLTKDMNVTVASIESGDIVLCLNGKTVTANGTEATSADRFYYLKKTATVTITDCTAKLEGDVYTAGKLTGATAAAIMTDTNSGTKNTGTVTVYDGIFTGNSRAGAGGAFCIQGDTKLYIYGGEISGNTAQNGAAVYLGNAKNTMFMENARVLNNTSTNSVGAIRNANTAAVTIKDTIISGNTGVYSAVINSNGAVTLENVTIIGNHGTGTNETYQFGAVSVNAGLTLKGKVVINGNTFGAENVQNNLYLRTDKLLTANELAAASQIGITAQSAALGLVMSNVLADTSVVSCFKSDVAQYSVDVLDGKLVLAEAPLSHETSNHNCEHCDEENVVWTPWDNSHSTLPTAAGHYYLTEDLSVVKTDLSADVVLCLNGKTVTCNGSYNTANDRFYYLKNGGTITVTDCTATGSGDNYKAGKFTGASASAFMFDNVNSSVGSINIYDGIFDGNFRSSAGGVFAVQGKGTLNIYGGLYSNNSTNSGGAVINLVSNNNHVHIENAVFKNNTAASKGGVLFNNYLSNVTIKDTVITGNTAADGSAIYAKGNLTLENTQITGNKTTGQSGAVTMANAGAQTMTIKGGTQITGNTDGADTDATQRNVFMLDEANKIAVEDLAGTAAISVSGEKGKVLTDALDNADAIVSCFAADDAELIVAVKDSKLVLDSAVVIVPDHPHKLCNDSACADHEEMDFKNWTDPNSLPTNGSYSLQTDVTLTAAVAVEGKLNLCLNGHTITVAAENTRAIGLDNGDVLSLTDCQGTGKITGGNCKYGGAIVVARGSVFNLFAGAITGNDGLTEEGGAVYIGAGNDSVKQGGIFNMYGGELSNNKARQGAAVRLTAPSGAGTNAQFNMYGGKITGNSTTTGAGAAIYASKATVKLLGGEISGNTTGSTGTIYAGANIDLTISDVTITGNTAGNGAGIYLSGETAKLTLSGKTTILGNTAGDKANNLVLNDTAVITVDQLGQSAKIGVTATVGNRAISGENETDYSAFFQSDSVYKLIRYKEKMLFIEATSDHSHCICSASASGCDHTVAAWQAWDVTTSLPTAEGNYYLVEDVTLSTAAQIGGETNICLNGHTVSVKEGAKNVRLLAVSEGMTLSITDCQGTGKLTGGNRTYGSCVNVAKNATFNFYGGTITGNVNEDTSGGMGTIYAGGENATVNIYGGEISGNKAYWGGAAYGDTGAYVNVYGGLLANNEAYRGGAIFATNILLDGATIRDNQTTSHGGGIYVSGGEATVKNSLIEGNSTVGSAGAIMASGRGTKLTIDNTIIQNNHGGGYAGGAIQAQTTGTEVNITNSQIIGNTIVSNGGAIYMSYDTILNVESTTFTGNQAEKGACIFEERAVINLGKGVVMEGNIADTTNANASRRAAGIYMAAGELNIDGAVIKNNYGLKNGQKISVSGVAITTTHSDETVKDENGQDTKVRHYSTVNMLSGSIVGNKANSGAVLIQGKATFNLKGGEISNNTGSYAGGVYISTNATFNMSGGKISGNSATSAGGGVYLQQATFNMTAGTISGNTSKGHGGGVYAARGTMNLKGGSITGNVATNSGGGIFASGAAVNLSGTSITYNKADKGSGGGGICTGARGENGITYNATIVMTGGYIANNDSKNGGGILLQGSDKTTMVMYGGEVANNVSRGDGGGIYISTKTTFTMEGGKIYGNEAAGRGGAVNHLKSTGIYTGGEIYDNYAGNTAGAIQAGNVGTDVTVKNMVFRNNNAAKFGGTFQMNGTAKLYLENVEIHGSNCETAGALYVSNSHYFEAKNLTITDSHATKSGGAMYLGNNATVRIDGLTVENCTAENRGGAIYCRSANTIIKNATFIGNEAVKYGGAISLYKPTLQGVAGSSNYKEGFVLEGGVFRDNKTEGYGGALTVDSGSKCTLTNVVMENNTSTGDGAALHAVGETTINGLVATGNVAENGGYAVYIADSEYDGQSFVHGMMRFGGDMIVKDNQGGDMYMGEQTTASVLNGTVGENTEMHITLASGLLTNKLFGAYNYEGGDLVYTVTYGNRSLTEPEYEEKIPEETQPEETTVAAEPAEAGEDNTLLYAAIGGIAAVIVLAAVILVIVKKKSGSKAGKE